MVWISSGVTETGNFSLCVWVPRSNSETTWGGKRGKIGLNRCSRHGTGDLISSSVPEESRWWMAANWLVLSISPMVSALIALCRGLYWPNTPDGAKFPVTISRFRSNEEYLGGLTSVELSRQRASSSSLPLLYALKFSFFVLCTSRPTWEGNSPSHGRQTSPDAELKPGFEHVLWGSWGGIGLGIAYPAAAGWSLKPVIWGLLGQH